MFYFHFKVINEELGKRLLLLLLLQLPKLIIAGVCGFCSSSAGEIEHIFNVSRNVNERVPCSQLPDIIFVRGLKVRIYILPITFLSIELDRNVADNKS